MPLNSYYCNPLKRAVLTPILSLLVLTGSSQIPIGAWRDHLPYKKGVAVTFSSEKVWCATEGGLFEVNKADDEVTKLGKANGFSDVGPSDVKYNNYNGTLVVAYKNSNIDLVDGSSIINISDIKRAGIIGNKTINSIHMLNDYAYLACGFGIVVLDTRRKEIKDTYYLGVNGGYINVRDIATDASNIYAATDSGVYRASLSNPNLANFAAWTKYTGLPNGVFNTICCFNNKIYVNFSKAITSFAYGQDTVFVYDGSSWNWNFTPPSTYNCYSIESTATHIAFANDGYIDVYDAANTLIDHIWTYFSSFIYPRQAILESPTLVWVADANQGLVRVANTWNAARYFPQGPGTAKVYGLDVQKQNVWVAPGEHSDLWDNSNPANMDGVFYFKEDTWNTIDRNTQTILDSIRDICDVTVNPENPEQVYATTLGHGIVEINNGVVTSIWDENNSTLEVRADDPNSGWVGSYGSMFDEDGNLWVSNAKSNAPIHLRKPDGSWYGFNFGVNFQQLLITSIVMDQDKKVWGVLPRSGGILCYDPGADIANAGDDQVKRLITGTGNGNLPSMEIYSIACDHDNEIWFGTDRGVGVIYSPENVFNGNNYDAQQILVSQDGHTQILLETEIITAITIDGANRKWIGTQNAGAYLLSSDGQEQIYHFEETNSPLLSNTITSIAIDGETGEVYFGTAKGLCSYRSTATDGLDEFTDVYAFPNPVRPGYTGNVAIRGLVKDCHVKITDISGFLVYQTKALGGQAIWDCKNFTGERVRSGVYIVFLTNDDGSKTYVTKILVVN